MLTRIFNPTLSDAGPCGVGQPQHIRPASVLRPPLPAPLITASSTTRGRTSEECTNGSDGYKFFEKKIVEKGYPGGKICHQFKYQGRNLTYIFS
jgi:hypothetical protein